VQGAEGVYRGGGLCQGTHPSHEEAGRTWSASRACRGSRDGRSGIVLVQLKAYLP